MTARGSARFSLTVGYFTNPVCLHTHITDHQSFRGLLQQVRQTVLEALEHQEYPFASLVEQLKPRRDSNVSPLFQVLFSLERSHLPEQQNAPLYIPSLVKNTHLQGMLEKERGFMEREVLIAESSEILRAGLQAVIMGHKDVIQLHEAATNEELYTQLRSKSFDMVVVNQSLITDISMLPRGRFVILTAVLDRVLFQRAYRHGARGYLLESTSAELLRTTLCLEEESFLIDPSLAVSILESFSPGLRFPIQDHLLSPREKEVVGLLREGMDRKRISQKLYISESTLKTHIKHIKSKMCFEQ